ncbi:MAG: KH domain-containing protein [Candidatus Lokiarchaeota archaeon]|nr:KH domain-containing protein [Candidatus Lokiarchaeota archaeon]
MSFKDEEQGIKDNNQEEEEEAVNTEDDSDPDEFEDEETTRNLVVPGEILTTDTKTFSPGRGTILTQDRSKIISLNIGLKQTKKNYINVIPLRGFYTPRPGDKVLALVTDKNPVKYRLDINSKEDAILKPKNTMKRGRETRGMRGGPPDRNTSNTDMFNIGDILIAKILSADRLNSPELTTVGKYLGKKNNGIVISIDPPKIPRVIGREGSMIKNLKNLTKSTIFVTQNGRIWLKAEDIAHERLLVDAIRKIEREAHTVGLTDRMVDYIENEKKKRGLK